jgi:nucleotide-binding universal stress UspA family protein
MEVRFGDISGEILNAVEEQKANLLVAATHGRRGFQHWLIGSVCERLLRMVHIPILTIGRVKKFTGLPNIQRVLIGVDFSDGCAEAVSYGLSLAQQSQANVTLLHVANFAMGDLTEQYKESLMKGLPREMEKLIPARAKPWCQVTTRVEFGIPYRVILKMAERQKTDIIVLGTHGKSLLDRALVGSNAERVVRGASCPVLAIPPKRRKNP